MDILDMLEDFACLNTMESVNILYRLQVPISLLCELCLWRGMGNGGDEGEEYG
jgi:hypothetical protein